MQQSQPIKAFFWVFGAIFLFSAMAIAGRELGPSLDTFEIMFYRSLIGIVLVLSAAKLFGTLHEINTGNMSIHLGRNITHFAGQNLWFFALNGITLAQLFAFEFSTPIWVALFAPFILKEKLTPTRLLCVVLGFIGILFVAQPETGEVSWYLIAAILCPIGFAGSVIGTKLLTRTQTTTCIMFWLVFLQAIFGLICAGYDGDIALPNTTQFGYLAIIGFCGLAAHSCLANAMSYAPAIVVAPFDFLRLPLIAVVAYFLYSEILAWPVFIGAVIVFAANILNIRSELKLQKP